MTEKKSKIGILGAGSWGTALTVLMHANGHEVTLWEFQKEAAEELSKMRLNPDFLPGVTIPDSVQITSNLEAAISGKELILLTLPSHVVRSVAEKMKKMTGYPLKNTLIVCASKGIENKTLLRMSEVLSGVLSDAYSGNIVALSGPSHAEEVGRFIPTVITVASKDEDSCRRVQQIFMSPSFRVYTNPDIIGVELGGALKNVIAIAAGISDGVGFGDNTKAALLNRGIVEITRLGTAMGANPMTFAGLSGMGDLIVTCTSRHSRNRYVGEQIGKGKKLQQVLGGMVQVAEGVRTTRSAKDLALKMNVDMPITMEVYEVLFNDKSPKNAVYDLMTRDPKAEDWG